METSMYNKIKETVKSNIEYFKKQIEEEVYELFVYSLDVINDIFEHNKITEDIKIEFDTLGYDISEILLILPDTGHEEYSASAYFENNNDIISITYYTKMSPPFKKELVKITGIDFVRKLNNVKFMYWKSGARDSGSLSIRCLKTGNMYSEDKDGEIKITVDSGTITLNEENMQLLDKNKIKAVALDMCLLDQLKSFFGTENENLLL